MTDITENEIAEIRNLIKVKDIVRRSENPHPITIVIIIITVVLVMCCIYVTFIKKPITGIWVDDEDNTYNIIQNKWTDTIIINGKFYGLLKGNIVIVYLDDRMQMGIWMDNRIKWMDDSVWYCSYGH